MHATKLTSMERGFRFSDRNREREKMREKMRAPIREREREKRKGEDFFFVRVVLVCVLRME